MYDCCNAFSNDPLPFCLLLLVARAGRHSPTEELSDRIRKLLTKEVQNRNEDKEDNSAYEFGTPVNLAGSSPIKTAEDRIAIYLGRPCSPRPTLAVLSVALVALFVFSVELVLIFSYRWTGGAEE